MEMLEYKGYFGNIEYSKDDNCLYGQVVGLKKNVCIIYEGNTAKELYDDFKNGIDHYLADCMADGIQPEKTYNGVLNIYIPSDIHIKIAEYAENQKTSIDAFVRDSIERRLEAVL